jgi:hypothetical protein
LRLSNRVDDLRHSQKKSRKVLLVKYLESVEAAVILSRFDRGAD